MIEILNSKNNKIYYKCDCGAKGFYTIKPLKKDAILVIDITCPLCLETARLTISQYNTNKDESGEFKDLNEVELEWSPIINNDFI